MRFFLFLGLLSFFIGLSQVSTLRGTGFQPVKNTAKMAVPQPFSFQKILAIKRLFQQVLFYVTNVTLLLRYHPFFIFLAVFFITPIFRFITVFHKSGVSFNFAWHGLPAREKHGQDGRATGICQVYTAKLGGLGGYFFNVCS